MGLVNKVVPAAELDAAVKDWTDKLAQRSPTAIALAKRSFNADSDNIRGISNLAAACREAVLRYGGIEGRRRRLQRETDAGLPQVHLMLFSATVLTAPMVHRSAPHLRAVAERTMQGENIVARKVIISCAVTGSIHTPSMSPHLPVTAAEIAESALGAAEAGAAIVHLHARNPQDGRPDQSPEAFEPFLRIIKQQSNVVVNLTTGGSPYMTVEERIKPAAVWKPEIASLNMGSMNFGLFPMLKRFKTFKHDWEPAMLEGFARSASSATRSRTSAMRLETLNGNRRALRVRVLRHQPSLQSALFLDRGTGEGPVVHPDRVRPARRHRPAPGRRHAHEAHRRSPVRRQLSLVGAGAGRAQMPVAAIAAAIGGNVRVGLEDSLWIGAGKLAASNADQVTQVRKIIEGLGLEIATRRRGAAKSSELRQVGMMRRSAVGTDEREALDAATPQGLRRRAQPVQGNACGASRPRRSHPNFQRWEEAGIIDRSLLNAGGACRAALPASARKISAAPAATSGTTRSSSRNSAIPASRVPPPTSRCITTSAAAICSATEPRSRRRNGCRACVLGRNHMRDRDDRTRAPEATCRASAPAPCARATSM